jgi:drug/metabolite transporter (DMT)-like permease
MNPLKERILILRNYPHILLIFPPLFWAGNVVLGRGVNQIIPPVTLAFWRWAIALVFLLPFTWKRVKKDWPTVQRHWKIMLMLSFLGIACFNTMLYTAVHTTTAIDSALIQTSMPAWIVVFSLLLFNERIRLVQAMGVAICIVGAFLIIAHGEWSYFRHLSFVAGDIWMLAAVVLYALYSILLRKRPATDDLSFITITFGMGGLMLLPLYLWEVSVVGGIGLSGAVVGSILYVALFPSILAYLCWNRGVELVGANQGGLYINLTPVFASVLAVLLLGESLHLFHLVGVMMIVGGMVLYNRMHLRP